MPTALTPVNARTAITKPVGSDVFSLAAINGMSQSIADRAEWAAKSLIDIKTARITEVDGDSGTSFADMYSLDPLNFTNVSVGDVILLQASLVAYTAEFVADGTDPAVSLRWLVGGVDVSIGPGSTYPEIVWGSSIGASPTDFRCLNFVQPYTAVGAGSLQAKLQAKSTTGHQVVHHYCQVVGTHYRLGAA
jgi:hypothetical protein